MRNVASARNGWPAPTDSNGVPGSVPAIVGYGLSAATSGMGLLGKARFEGSANSCRVRRDAAPRTNR